MVEYQYLAEIMKGHKNWLPAIETFCDHIGMEIINKPKTFTESTKTQRLKNDPLSSVSQSINQLPTPPMPALTPQVTCQTNDEISDNNAQEVLQKNEFPGGNVGAEHVMDLPGLSSTPRITRLATGSITKRQIHIGFTRGEKEEECQSDILDDSREDADYKVSDEESESDEEQNQKLNQSSVSNWNFKSGVKKTLKDLGMYNRIPENDKYLAGLRKYMEVDLKVDSKNHINITSSLVARFFYFIQGGPTVNPQNLDPNSLLHNRQKVTEWKQIYQESKAGGTPILNTGKALSK